VRATKQAPAAVASAASARGTGLPRHIAIIMDGNRRWARREGKSDTAGHRAGVVSLRTAVRLCSDLGVEYLTCYAFSTENWKRSAGEVEGLWALALEFLRSELPELVRQHVRVRVIGDRARLPLLVRQAAQAAESATGGSRGLGLTLALSYGARWEIALAARALCRDVASGALRPDDVDEEALAARLETAGMPDPDLLIRTGGEQRVSNFLLWQIAYSEIWVTPALWPDFGEAELREALEAYRRRDRRFGGGPGGDG
jgi:undecaprenyl diphosphate synthase